MSNNQELLNKIQQLEQRLTALENVPSPQLTTPEGSYQLSYEGQQIDRSIIPDLMFSDKTDNINGTIYELNATQVNLYDSPGSAGLSGWTFRCGGYGEELAEDGGEEEGPEAEGEAEGIVEEVEMPEWRVAIMGTGNHVGPDKLVDIIIGVWHFGEFLDSSYWASSEDGLGVIIQLENEEVAVLPSQADSVVSEYVSYIATLPIEENDMVNQNSLGSLEVIYTDEFGNTTRIAVTELLYSDKDVVSLAVNSGTFGVAGTLYMDEISSFDFLEPIIVLHDSVPKPLEVGFTVYTDYAGTLEPVDVSTLTPATYVVHYEVSLPNYVGNISFPFVVFDKVTVEPDNPEPPPDALPAIPADWADNISGVKLLIHTARGDIAVPEIKTVTGLDWNVVETSVYTIMLVKPNMNSIYYNGIVLSEAPIRLDDMIWPINQGGTGISLPENSNMRNSFIHYPLNGFNPNVITDISYTLTVHKNFQISPTASNFTAEELASLVTPDSENAWIITNLVYSGRNNTIADHKGYFSRIMQIWKAIDYSAHSTRLYMRYCEGNLSIPTVANWTEFMPIYNEQNPPYAKTGLISNLTELNDMTRKSGIYPFDLRGANQGIALDSRNTVTTGSIIHMRHNNYDTYPCQLLIPFAANLDVPGMWKRTSNNTTWGVWLPIDHRRIIENENVLNNTNLPTGLYEVTIPGYNKITGIGVSDSYFLLIAGKYTVNESNFHGGEYGHQIALTFGDGQPRGIYYRVARNNTWSKWYSAEESAYNVKYLAAVGAPTAGYNSGQLVPKIIPTIQEENDPNFPYPYITTVHSPDSATLGLPANTWYHLLYFRHWDNNGYGAQLAIPYVQDQRARFRMANGNNWMAWRELYDSYLPKVGTATFFPTPTNIKDTAVYTPALSIINTSTKFITIDAIIEITADISYNNGSTVLSGASMICAIHDTHILANIISFISAVPVNVEGIGVCKLSYICRYNASAKTVGFMAITFGKLSAEITSLKWKTCTIRNCAIVAYE